MQPRSLQSRDVCVQSTATPPLIDQLSQSAPSGRFGARAEFVSTLAELEKLATGAIAQTALLLHEAEQAGCELPQIQLQEFGDDVIELVEGQRAAGKVWSLHSERSGASAAEGLRRLLLAIIRDLRVVFILLAGQLVRMRNASDLDEAERRALAQLTVDIHAPLANRLGIWQIKWELEDLAFRYLQPDTYRRIADLLDERRDDREAWIAQSVATLRDALQESGIEADIAGRPKHISSIWRKMQKKGLDFSELYDIRALRVLVKDIPSCYAALGVVHSLWPFIAGEFDDYIASPKGNNYQSLHTAVIGPEGRTLEVQIRSYDMHAYAELGSAAPWRYKEAAVPMRVSSARSPGCANCSKIGTSRRTMARFWRRSAPMSSRIASTF